MRFAIEGVPKGDLNIGYRGGICDLGFRTCDRKSARKRFEYGDLILGFEIGVLKIAIYPDYFKI